MHLSAYFKEMTEKNKTTSDLFCFKAINTLELMPNGTFYYKHKPFIFLSSPFSVCKDGCSQFECH